MKILIQITVCFFVILFLFVSCKKDNDQKIETPPPVIIQPVVNLPPIAKAGADLSLSKATCGEIIAAYLDGTGSFDPENNIKSYTRRQISGPPGFIIENSTKPVAYAEIRRVGTYEVELMVADEGGLQSRDTSIIIVKLLTAGAFDLDITFDASFTFSNNLKDCGTCSYYDYLMINGIGNFQPLGPFKLDFYEYTDSSNSTPGGLSNITMSNANRNIWIDAISDMGLKKLYMQGGGAFSSTLLVDGGSAKECNYDVFQNVAPLIITGNMDTTARKATITIKGKTYF